MQKILLIALIAPMLVWLWQPDHGALELENRTRAEMPAFPAKLSDLSDYLSQVDFFVADNIGLRDQLFATKTWLDLRVNGPGNARVIKGQGGWFFYNATHVFDRNAGREFVPSRVDNMLRFAQEAQELAEANGARMLVMPVPNSHAIYRKYLPAWAQFQGEPRTEQRAIVETLKERSIVTTDPYLLFQAFDLDATPLYFRRDTHWNDFGAYVAFHDAMVQFGLADRSPPPEAILQGYADGEQYGVLDQFLGQAKPLAKEPLPILDMTAFEAHPELTFTETDDHVSMDSYEVTYDTHGPRLLVIGDSFSYGFFRKYWGSVFGVVHWSHHDYGRYDRSVFERYKPDYVIFEFVDWEIPAWIAFDTRPVP